MNYRPRPGVILTKICDFNVLIPSRAAYPACATIRALPMLWAITWELLEKDETEDRILQVHRILTKKSDEEIRDRLESFCRELCGAGFLIEGPKEKTS